MDPQKWGAGGWHMLHRLAYKVNDIQEAKQFYMSFEHILPCSKCRKNYTQHILNVPFPSRVSNVSKWVYEIHNRVNTHLAPNRIKIIPTFADVDVYYKNVASGFTKEEVVFLRAILQTHPGKMKASKEYTQALKEFSESVFPLFENIDFASRRQFACLVRSNIKR